MEKGSTVEAINKLRRIANQKDEKIVELNGVIESERAFVRKSELEKAALEKELKALKVHLTIQSLFLGDTSADLVGSTATIPSIYQLFKISNT